MNQQEYIEINFSKYIAIVSGHKFLILIMVVLFGLINLARDYAKPRICEISMVLEAPSINPNATNYKDRLLDALENIKAKIDSHAFDQAIIREAGFDSDGYPLNLRVSIPPESTFMRVQAQFPEEDAPEGLKAMHALVEHLRNEYQTTLDFKKSQTDQTISQIVASIEAKKLRRESTKRSLQASNVRENELKKLLGNIREGTSQSKLKTKTSDTTNTPNAPVPDTPRREALCLADEAADLTQNKERLEASLDDLNNEIMDLNAEIKRQESNKTAMANIRLIQKPNLSAPSERLPKKTQSLVSGAISGLFLGICISFLLDWRAGLV